ncbi:MAG TPA: AAA family ATPase [Roseiflexaceae bacterium]|nr:AAA family ATPase [Roseiflexaceae bacterium]
MALEPYRPPSDNRYRDELDREIDQKIDTLFHRWNWKLARFIRRAIIVLFVLWVAANVIPSAFEFVTTQPLGPVILQLLSVAGYLFVFIGFQFGLMYFFMARTRIYWVKPGETGIGFKDYKGNPEVLEAATRIVTLLKGVKGFKSMGGEVTRGVLLIGPPGTGKSYLAQAISTEAGVPFGYLSAPSLTSVWMGMGNIKVMMLYRKARKLAREYGACILFIDEIDAIGGARSASMMGGAIGTMSPDKQSGGRDNVVMGMGGGMGGGSGLLNELLLQMDPPPQETSQIGKALRWLGLRKKRVEMPPVLTMGATNLAETLDQALLRPGRFDRKIVVEEPDADGRREIIEYYLGKVKHEPMPMDRMISDTIGFTPVAIKFIINEAAIHAHFEGRQAITYWDFTHAREMHEWGLRQPIRGMSYEERRRLAYHEAGHAYAAVKLLRKERLTKVTIVRHGSALGFAAWKPEQEIHTRTKDELLNRVQISLASRAAEELFLNIQMSGVTGDLQSATGLAAYMIGAYGMDESFYSYLTFGMQGMTAPDMKPRIEAMLNEQFRNVKRLLENNKEGVIAIAEALILRNELTDIDVNEILARVEAQHPFVDPHKTEERPFGLVATRALPEPSIVRRNGRQNGASNGHGSNGNGKPGEIITVPLASQPPAEPSGPAAELDSGSPEDGDDMPSS